jgi:hypothetical protein
MQITVSKNELYTMIKKAVKDVIHEERIDLILKNIPEVSDEEMRDIEERYGKPKKRRAVRREMLDV